jgi:hypothetical protein
MPSPFFDLVKGTTAGTPGTGSFTPNAAASGNYRAWSTVPAGWIGKVRYDDGAAAEIEYSYWNGTLLTRPSNIVWSSSGSKLSLTSSATAMMVEDPAELQPHLGGVTTRGFIALLNSASAPTALGTSGPTSNLGTGAAINPTTTSALTEQPRAQLTSATTASAQSGWASTNVMCISNTTAGRGGGEFTSRFGVSSIPTGPRLFVGLSSATFAAQTIEPSAFTAHVAAFAKDSTDTNIQFLTNSNAGAGTKIDTRKADPRCRPVRRNRCGASPRHCPSRRRCQRHRDIARARWPFRPGSRTGC